MNRRGFLGGLAAVLADVKLPWPFRRRARIIRGHNAIITCNGQVIGTFKNIEFKSYPATPPPFVLGADNNPWLDYDFSKPITCTVKGWRVVENKLDADQA